MKKIIAVFIVLSLIGCAQQHYIIPQGKTQSDFQTAREVCEEQNKQIGGFIIAPVIVLLPIVGVISAVNYSKKKSFEKCMLEMGYICKEGCVNDK